LVEGKSIKANKCILIARSPKFHAMFTVGMKETNETTISIPEATYNAFYALIWYLYTDEAKVDADVAIELLSLASQYLLQRLQDLCEQFLHDNLSEDNVISLIIAAELYNATQLKKGCLYFVKACKKNLNLNIDGFNELSKELQNEIIKINSK